MLTVLPGCKAQGSANLAIGNPEPPPPPKAVDTDGDGVDDGNDKCPDQKEDGLAPEPKDGCPTTDADQDGVLGEADKCPDKPETKNGFQDDDGCPDEKPADSAVKVTGTQIEISEEIKFVTGSAEIDHASDKLIADIAKAINDNPDIEFIEVAGHTDIRGAAAGNKLRAVGYGPYCLKDKAETEEAHAKNRRVEFDILRRGGKDLDIKWGGCPEAEKKGMKPQPLPKPAPAKAEPAKKLSGF
jgi:outer membrane protein OmpA-like peptidoglycan-associated protein